MSEVSYKKEIQLRKSDFLKTSNYLELEKLIEPKNLEDYLKPEEVLLVEGLCESGKTKLLMYLTRLALNNNKHLLFISVGAKTIKEELVARFKDNGIDVSNMNLLTLYVSEKHYEFITELIKNTLKGHIIVIDDFSNLEVNHLEEVKILKELAKEYELTIWCSAISKEENTYTEYVDSLISIED